MLMFGLLGAGNIAKVHAANLAAGPRTRLKHVVDVNASAAGELATAYGAQVSSLAATLADREVAAVLIATPGNTHSELIEAAAKAGKAIFCEKPIGIDVDQARQALDVARTAGVRLTIGFHRRFDPSFLAAQQRIAAGEIGALQVLSITSRDPGVPTLEQSRAAGGMFCETFIHDMDMARWFLAEEPSEVFAMGSCLVDPQLADADDVDSVVLLSDGSPSRGRYDRDFRILQEFPVANRFRRMAVNTVLVGTKGADRKFMQDLAAATGGRFRSAGDE